MKNIFLSAAIMLTLCAGALEIAVAPLKTNALKEASVKDQTVTGISMPGCSIDFPFKGKFAATAGFNRAVLTVEPGPDGLMPCPGDFLFNLRNKGYKKTVDAYGAAGEKANEIVFQLNDPPEESILIRLYPDYRQAHKGKKISLKIKGLRLEKVGKAPLSYPILKGYARVNNCTKSAAECNVFSGIPENVGSSVIFTNQAGFKPAPFTKAELDLTVIEGNIAVEGLSLNPRKGKIQPESYAVETAPGKYTFTFAEPMESFDRILLYFNRKNTLKNKPVKFKVNRLVLIP